ncbi:endonuclease Q family protein [Breznakiellaceae bacterium SP9]
MKHIADLHIHSSYSRATAKSSSPCLLERWARIKGVSLLGTGDCTHPLWLKELRADLDDAEDGLYLLKPAQEQSQTLGLPLPPNSAPLRFVLTGELSTIYRAGGKTRKVHHLVILPSFAAAAAFQSKLARIGTIQSDGRPTLNIDSIQLLQLLLDCNERSILIPAHIWTPWFGCLGAKSGFDSLEECYGSLSKYVPAIETGLSSNPPMNWALSRLDAYAIVSNSDAHSPEKISREATLINMETSYQSLWNALYRRKRENKGSEDIIGTIEFFPQEGKYHYSGHRNCRYFTGPSADSGALCPVCGKPLTQGVMNRILELADRTVDESAPCPSLPEGNKRPYYSVVGLKEILGELLTVGPASKKVGSAYHHLISHYGTELAILMDVPSKDIETWQCPGLSVPLLAGAITNMRSGAVRIHAGYDGLYGVIKTLSAPRENGLLF